MPTDTGTEVFNCLCGKLLILSEPMATHCPNCGRSYWRYFDEKGTYARLVWHPDEKILDKEYDKKIKVTSDVK
jgi:predicted  nucleic acid-binding Zn-ribbon protein